MDREAAIRSPIGSPMADGHCPRERLIRAYGYNFMKVADVGSRWPDPSQSSLGTTETCLCSGVSLPRHTHLYPGALLHSLESPGYAPLSSGDEMLVEFSDGVSVTGCLPDADGSTALLQMPAYRTRRRTTVQARTWRIISTDEPGLFRVHKC